jgi:hypothetical protein
MSNIFNFLSISLVIYFSFYFFPPKGVTTMLNFFTTSNGFRSTLPVVSNLTAMNIWDGVCMCFIYASLLEFVCVNYVGRKRPLHNVVYRPGENPVTQVSSNRLLELKIYWHSSFVIVMLSEIENEKWFDSRDGTEEGKTNQFQFHCCFMFHSFRTHESIMFLFLPLSSFPSGFTHKNIHEIFKRSFMLNA